MTGLIANGLSRSRSSSLTGVSRSMIYYRHRERKPEYDADLERRISDIVTERPSYGTRRVTAMKNDLTNLFDGPCLLGLLEDYGQRLPSL